MQEGHAFPQPCSDAVLPPPSGRAALGPASVRAVSYATTLADQSGGNSLGTGVTFQGVERLHSFGSCHLFLTLFFITPPQEPFFTFFLTASQLYQI